jgi:hypothetical protein
MLDLKRKGGNLKVNAQSLACLANNSLRGLKVAEH